MPTTITREALYERLWSTPMNKLAQELGTTVGILAGVCRRADVPTPPPGHWMKKAFGKAVEQPSLPEARAIPDPIVIGGPRGGRGRVHSKASLVPARGSTASAPPRSVHRPAKPEAPARSTGPITLAREALYNAVWETPMSRLGPTYGISGNGLAKICARANIPYPPRGYWAQLAAGQTPNQPPLPAAPAGGATNVTIRPTPPPPTTPELPDDVAQTLRTIRADTHDTIVPERLVRPHPIVAHWIADHDERRRQARQHRDPWMRDLAPKPFTDVDRRRHRLQSVLFKALERRGAKIHEDERRVLFAEVTGERIEFQLREKLKKGRRPLTADELRWRAPGEKDWRQELLPTGQLVFEIKTYLPDGLRREWLESKVGPLESQLSDIVATFVAEGPMILQRRREREAAERERQAAEQRRREEQQLRKREANRWRRFVELAHDWRDLTVASSFLETLRSHEFDPEQQIEERSVADWISWAEDRLKRADIFGDGVGALFADVAAIREWSFRD